MRNDDFWTDVTEQVFKDFIANYNSKLTTDWCGPGEYLQFSDFALGQGNHLVAGHRKDDRKPDEYFIRTSLLKMMREDTPLPNVPPPIGCVRKCHPRHR